MVRRPKGIYKAYVNYPFSNYNFSKMANYGNGYKILSDGKLK